MTLEELIGADDIEHLIKAAVAKFAAARRESLAGRLPVLAALRTAREDFDCWVGVILSDHEFDPDTLHEIADAIIERAHDRMVPAWDFGGMQTRGNA